jgi:hypothetical protein
MTVRKRWAAVAATVVALGAVIAALVPAASESSTQDRLFAYVLPATRGPLPACSQDGSDCTDANTVRHYIYVVNANRLDNVGGNRATIPNAFVASSVEMAVFVDGVEVPDFRTTFTPPPNPFTAGTSGNWPSTVTCPATGPPCNVVGSPAVDPGEATAITIAALPTGTPSRTVRTCSGGPCTGR